MVVIGDASVGKTSFISRFTENEFTLSLPVRDLSVCRVGGEVLGVTCEGWGDRAQLVLRFGINCASTISSR